MKSKKTYQIISVFLFYLFTLSITLFVALQLYSQDLMLKATKVQKGPDLDGSLDDEVWRLAEPLSGLKMIFPNPGSDPTERTEIRILTDDSNLYIGIYCYDSEPGQIAANTMSHDAEDFEERSSDDVVRILLDSFQNKRTAYIFIVNARGARAEGIGFGEFISLSWDGIWNAKSKINEDGWSTEIKIPFKTIGFKSGLKTWGINIERYIPRKQETIRLSGISRNSFFANPMEAASLEGIEGARQGLGVTFRPYGIASSYKNVAADLKADYDWNGGLDIYKNITPNLTGAFTYNTDFAETEVDERRINLTRFPLFFPEKRTFFLEGSEIFRFGGGGYRVFHPFFSRKIGLYRGHQVPIDFGFKLFGRIGNTNVGALNIKTKAYKNDLAGIDLAPQNFTAVRISQNIWSESQVGVMFTNGSPSGEKNTLAGFDFTFQTSRFMGDKNFLAQCWYLYNWNSIETGRHQGYGLRLDYPNDLWDINASYNFFGDALNPGIGFIARNGVRTSNLGFSFQPRPEKGLIGDLVRQFFFELRFNFFWNMAGELETRQIFMAPLNFQTESGERFELNIRPNRDVLPYDFEVADGIVLPAGPYNFTQYALQFESASYRPWIVDVQWGFGQFYSGRYHNIEAQLAYKLKGYATVGLSANFVRGYLPQGNFSENVYEVKADIFLTPNLGLMNYIQYDDVSRNLGINSRFRWVVSPGNEIYLIYNKSWERRFDPTSRFFPLEGRGVFKITLSIRP